ARRDETAARTPQAEPRVRCAAAAGRLPLSRCERPGPVRGPRSRPPRATAVVLPVGTSATGGRGGTRGARARRVAGALIRDRGGAGGAPPDPRAAAARQRALDATGSLRLPAPPW